jgi:hypothetical protein
MQCAGQVVAFYLFDVAERIDLARVPALIGSAGVPARLSPKPGTPAYVQYEIPPLSFDADALGAMAFRRVGDGEARAPGGR